MLERIKKSTAVLCSLILLASSLPANAVDIDTSIDIGNAGGLIVGDIIGGGEGDSLPIAKEVLLEHLIEEPDANTNASTLPFPVSYDLTTNSFLPALHSDGSTLSTVEACVYYQYTYAANRMNGAYSTSNSTIYSPAWVACSLRPYGNNTTIFSADECYDFLKEHGALHIIDDTTTSAGAAPTNEAKIREAMKTRLRSWRVTSIAQTGNTRTSDGVINIKTKLYYNGELPRVDLPYYMITKESTSTGHGNVVVMGLHKPTLNYFSGIIIGYDDNVVCDINGDGTISACERGAFKVIGGFNRGATPYWIMYDAMNKESDISGDWDADYATNYRAPRVPIFSSAADLGNCIFTASTRTHTTDVLARVRFVNTVHYKPSVTVVKTPSPDGIEPYTEYPTTQNGTNGSSFSESFTLLYDLSMAGLKRSNIASTANSYGLDISGGSVSGVTFVDDLGETVKTGVRDAYGGYMTTLGIPIGDLNYSGTVTTQDLVRLQNYLGGTREFSSLQMYLADADRDGDIDNDDLQKIMQIIAAG